jgi:hypothetical protein
MRFLFKCHARRDRDFSVKLETHEGTFADPATTADVAEVVAGLIEVGQAFVILNDDRDDAAYIQAAGTVGEDFIVEYRDGCAGEHYRADRRAKAAELVELLSMYLSRDPRWKDATTWHRWRVDQDPPSV